MAKTREERTRIESHTLAHPDHADARLARELGITRPTVRLARARLIARGELGPQALVIRADGSTYPARLAWRPPPTRSPD
jgi:hypothetical protein